MRTTLVSTGLKPVRILHAHAALKRRSSTVLKRLLQIVNENLTHRKSAIKNQQSKIVNRTSYFEIPYL